MLERVIASVSSALRAAGIPAAPAYPKTPAAADASAFVRVGVRKAADKSAGLSRYLGLRQDAERGETEVYGLRCELELSLDVYAPGKADSADENAALECAKTFDRAAAAISAMPELYVRELTCGAPGPDEETGLFRLSGGVKCAGLLTVADGGEDETMAFTDFVLRGELQT